MICNQPKTRQSNCHCKNIERNYSVPSNSPQNTQNTQKVHTIYSFALQANFADHFAKRAEAARIFKFPQVQNQNFGLGETRKISSPLGLFAKWFLYIFVCFVYFVCFVEKKTFWIVTFYYNAIISIVKYGIITLKHA